MSKFVVEIVGTATLGVFYLLMGNKQTGVLLGYWVITLFGVAISGAHFNPCVTLVHMFKKNPEKLFRGQRLIGFMYMLAQFGGGLIAAILSNFILETQRCHQVLVEPITVGAIETKTDNKDTTTESKWFAAMTSEVIGTFFFCFLFMLCTDKATQFSKDRVINCFIIAAAFCSSRLLSGGTLVSGIQTNEYKPPDGVTTDAKGAWVIPDGFEFPDDYCSKLVYIKSYSFKTTGPLLNPALYLGQALRSFDFSSILSYCLCPFVGGVLALVFYEFVFVKSQEYLDVDNESAENSDDSKEDIGNDIGGGTSGKKYMDDDEDATRIDA